MSGILTTFVQLPTSASAPGPSGTDRLWVKTSDGHIYYTDASNTDHDLTAGGASTGNWTFSGNIADLTGAGAMQLGNGTATSVKILPATLNFPSAMSMAATAQGATNTTGLTIQNNVADGASTVGVVMNNQTAISSGKWMSFRNAGTEQGYLTISGAAGLYIGGDNALAFIRLSSASGSSINYSTASVVAGSGIVNITDGTATVSLSGGVLTVPRKVTTNQAVAAAASLTIAPSSGDYVRINLSATAITSLTINAGSNGETMIVEVVQDGTGGRTIPSTWTNVAFAGGTYTATSTANKHDCITFVYSSSISKWLETGRALNMS